MHKRFLCEKRPIENAALSFSFSKIKDGFSGTKIYNLTKLRDLTALYNK